VAAVLLYALAVLGLLNALPARAAGVFTPALVAATPPVPAGFDITGFIQEATLDTTGAVCNPTHPRLAGGTVTINGQKIFIPCNTVLQLPAATMSYADLFNAGAGLAPAAIAPTGQTGMALTDLIGSTTGATIATTTPGLLTMKAASATNANLQTRVSASLPSYEMRVIGNVVNGRSIAGLVFVSQQQLNAGQGRVSCIDYSTGEMQVGGTLVDPTVACPNPVPVGVARVRLADVSGRFGKRHAAIGKCGADVNCVEEAGYDPRFTPDTENPTVHASTGFPMCIPRLNPFTAGVDPLCPQSNRPVAPLCASYDSNVGIPPFTGQTSGYCTTYVMALPGVNSPATCPGPDCLTDPTRQAPIELGDSIVFNGTLKADAAGMFISAHTIAVNVGIYTQPNTKPAYVNVEVVLAGTAALPVGGLAQEATERVKFVGTTSDPTNLVDLYALDQDPLSGVMSERLLGTQSPMSNAQLGRFRTATNTGGIFLPPTRNYRAVSRTLCADQPTGAFTSCRVDNNAGSNTFANGLVAGQFSLPNFEFIFPENLIAGQALVPNNFQDLPFLYCGSGPLDGPGSSSPVVGQLDPAPWGTPMQNPIFAFNLCPAAKAVAAPITYPKVVGAPDIVTIVGATWDNKKGTGIVNITATSSVSPASAGMFMTATITNSWMTPSAPGGVDNPIVAQMVLVSNTAGGIVCPTSAPCWNLSAPGFIIDPGIGPFPPSLVPPTSIVVRSSRGGTASIVDAAIKQVACVATKRLVCPL
jgi:hypothetical protein